jgi:hypothetical protein
MQTIRIKVIANNFFIYNADGEVNQDDRFVQWFRKTVKRYSRFRFYDWFITAFRHKTVFFRTPDAQYVIQQRQRR